MNRIIAILLAIIPSFSYAKCVVEEHDFEGALSYEGIALEGAEVFFMAQDGLGELIASNTRTNEDGTFKVTLEYSTYSGSSRFGKDQCDYSLKEVAVVIEKEDLVSSSEKLEVSGKRTTYNKAFKEMDAADSGAH